MRGTILVLGLLILFAVEILRVYFIMPFPGSQVSNTLPLAYYLHTYILYIRLLAIFIIAYPVYQVFHDNRIWKKVAVGLTLALYLLIFYLFNFKFTAERMFYQPKHKVFATSTNSKVPQEQLVLGVVVGNEAKAYPVEYIGYHHQVQDTVGGKPVMITYCTVCRTGRAFSPIVNGKKEDFRLVGMDHFNAMFEDATTKSWWQQATGVAVAGPLKGKSLEDVFSEQMTLSV
jgi:hypothetical protein